MRKAILLFMVMANISAIAQSVVVHDQVSFPEKIPAGGYSGITWLGEDQYAVVSDKERRDGFFRFTIAIDESGDIMNVVRQDFYGNNNRGRDNEGIAFFPSHQTLFISGETDNQVKELTFEGKPTGRKLALPSVFSKATSSYGLEALTYNAVTHRFWTTTESTLSCDGKEASLRNRIVNKLRLQSFDDNLRPREQFLYVMDKPTAKSGAKTYVLGVSALTALDDGRLLVLEREAHIPDVKLGAFVRCAIYSVQPTKDMAIKGSKISKAKALKKTLVTQWMTYVGLLSVDFANYEGMCLGPRLEDGGQVIVLLSDSQYQYAGILQDWFRTIVIY
ncbi:MAG: esterase-like activity of phytase family protein [Prevotella sp.]|nr:esterase-like activity of phytase family protein [Prevotella sp.]